MSGPELIAPGTIFSPDDITFYADPQHRSLEQAIAEADVLVSCPHSGAAIPGELAEFLAPEFTRRLQYDFSDQSTSPVARRWAEIDPRIVYVENPHPRMIRDPNRQKPDNLVSSLREAFARVKAAGPGQRADLSGVDAVRPVTFSFYPLLLEPASEAQLIRMADTFTSVADNGLGVYEHTRDELLARFVAVKLDQAQPHGGVTFSTLSFHDTMNHTTTRDGAVSVERDPADRLPAVVALSNRGDAEGEPLGEEPVTIQPALLRRLSEAHREGFEVASAGDVALNNPYLGSFEIINAAAYFRSRASEAEAAGLILGAVQAEFLREYLLGEANTAELMRPGSDWVAPDAALVDTLARRCKASWDRYRELVAKDSA